MPSSQYIRAPVSHTMLLLHVAAAPTQVRHYNCRRTRSEWHCCSLLSKYFLSKTNLVTIHILIKIRRLSKRRPTCMSLRNPCVFTCPDKEVHGCRREFYFYLYFLLMFCLFRRKMFSVVKYFQRNHFSKKMIFLKKIFGVWLVRKNTNNVKQNSAITASKSGEPNSGQTGRNLTSMVGFWLVSPESGRNFQISTKLAGIRSTGYTS